MGRRDFINDKVSYDKQKNVYFNSLFLSTNKIFKSGLVDRYITRFPNLDKNLYKDLNREAKDLHYAAII